MSPFVSRSSSRLGNHLSLILVLFILCLSFRTVIRVEDVEFYFLLPIDSPAARSERRGAKRGTKHARKGSADSSRRRSSNSNRVSADESSEHTADEQAPDSQLMLPPPTPGDLCKPPLSYACLIAEAIGSTEDKRLTLSGIYKFLSEKYPYFRYTKSGWQNSIRHNLSLNKAFRKVPRALGEQGKGMFWTIDSSFKHLVENTGAGRRNVRSKSLTAHPASTAGNGGGGGGQTSAPTSPHQRQNSSMLPAVMSNFVPILPTRPLSAGPALLAPQLLEAAAAAIDSAAASSPFLPLLPVLAPKRDDAGRSNSS